MKERNTVKENAQLRETLSMLSIQIGNGRPLYHGHQTNEFDSIPMAVMSDNYGENFIDTTPDQKQRGTPLDSSHNQNFQRPTRLDASD